MANTDKDSLIGIPKSQLLYGENAWQSPAHHYIDSASPDDPLAIDRFNLLVGNPSFNNIVDIDRLLQTITHMAAAFKLNLDYVPRIAVAVKHGNACGASADVDPLVTLKQMVDGDLRAIMGGLVMTNFTIDEGLAEQLITYRMPRKTGTDDPMRRLLDGVIAPSVTSEAIEMMKRKGDKCRIFTNPALAHLGPDSLDRAPLRRQVRGGYLIQPNYIKIVDLSTALPLPGSAGAAVPQLDHWTKQSLVVAWSICATSTSNTITIVKDQMLIGNGVGQQDRVGAAKLAIDRAIMSGHGGLLPGAVAASDSFFPFPDGVETLANAGIKTIIATSGSVRDADVGKRAAELGVSLIAHPDKEMRGFYNH